ncbi:MAG: hypothetical protein JRJ42_03330 [Deltaproteobacteria bacterium]|nr:hypothetical protein [Deltaproteobacteria bacterium]MBW2019255.1 hypothetical protein [Deltaproteobacteria bacterium]MBW2074061.1 hypothetical protein [Deltaproteobacteria bacterium]
MDIEQIERALLTLNYRVSARALNLWKGGNSRTFDHNTYDGFYEILNPTTIKRIRGSGPWTKHRQRLFHSLLSHYLQYRVSPYENELFTWMKGAAAHVDGEKIYFKDILSWCQKRSDLAKRRIVEKETSSLCKFLKPFALGFWEFFLKLLEDEFGYKDYAAYCQDKKQVDYDAYVIRLQSLLQQTDTLYFEAMEAWAQRSLGVSLCELNRFDAIYLLGLGEFDPLFPEHAPLSKHLDFFNEWGIEVQNVPGLSLDINHSHKKGAQAMSFALRIPSEIYVVMNPQGGWIDLETLFHEMGHALSHAFTSPELSSVEKDFFTSNTLSETYAFLLQNMSLSLPFLERHLGLSSKAIEEISFYKGLKDLSVFRRYVSKFLAEYQMFKKNEVENGEIYADLLEKHTGFSYRPETHLFDLVPEFYALDYVVSWMAEATLEKTLAQTLGHDWMFKSEAGKILKDWWQCGNQYELDEFFTVKGIGSIDCRDIVDRWRSKILGEHGNANHSTANDNAVV